MTPAIRSQLRRMLQDLDVARAADATLYDALQAAGRRRNELVTEAQRLRSGRAGERADSVDAQIEYAAAQVAELDRDWRRARDFTTSLARPLERLAARLGSGAGGFQLGATGIDGLRRAVE